MTANQKWFVEYEMPLEDGGTEVRSHYGVLSDLAAIIALEYAPAWALACPWLEAVDPKLPDVVLEYFPGEFIPSPPTVLGGTMSADCTIFVALSAAIFAARDELTVDEDGVVSSPLGDLTVTLLPAESQDHVAWSDYDHCLDTTRYRATAGFWSSVGNFAKKAVPQIARLALTKYAPGMVPAVDIVEQALGGQAVPHDQYQPNLQSSVMSQVPNVVAPGMHGNFAWPGINSLVKPAASNQNQVLLQMLLEMI